LKSQSVLISAIIALLLVLCAVAPSILAQSVGPIDLTGPSQPVEADPGDIATLVFQLSNNTASAKTFNFELTLPENIVPIAPLAPVTVGSGAEESIFLSLVIGRSALAGPAQIILEAIPESGDLEPVEATGEIFISSIANLEIISPPITTAEPGSEVELAFTLINRGNSSDRYTLSVTSSQDVALQFNPDELDLLPGEERDVDVEIEIPTELSGEQIRIRLSALSLNQNSETIALAAIDVLPALPSQVGGSLLLMIPSSLTLNFFSDPPHPLMISEVLSGGVAFASGTSFSYRISLRGLIQLDSFRFDFETSQLSASIGDLSAGLSPLFGLVGRGAAVGVFNLDVASSPRAQIALVRTPASFITFGGSAEATILGLTPAFSVKMSPSLGEILAGGALRSRIRDLGTFTLSAAFSRDSVTELGRALQIAQTLEFETFNVDLSFAYGGPNFLGRLRDSLSISVSQMLSTPGLSVQADFGFARNNVLNDPAIITIVNTDAGAGLRLPITSTTDITTEIEFTSSRDIAPIPTVNLQDFMLSTRLTQQLGALRLSAIHERTRSRDLIANTDYELTAWRSITDLQLGAFSTQIRIGLIQERDLINDLLISNYIETLISSRVRLSIAELQIVVERLPALTNLSVIISANLDNLALASKKTLAVSDSGDLDFSINLSATARFNLPFPFIKVQGRIEGVIYSDDNGNGRRDSGESGLRGVTLALNGQLVRTDATGFFRSQPLDPGQSRLRIVDLPEGYASLTDELLFNIGTGQVLNVAIPVRSIGFIRGSVFEDLNENGTRDSGERGLANVLVQITGAGGAFEDRTSSTGQFSREVEPGTYEVRVVPSTLPGRFQLTTAEAREVDVVLGEIESVQFGAIEVLEFRFAPIADFSVMPEEIAVGDVVTFNGSLSLDSDGEIVSYQWDYDGDGVVDATGAIVTTTFTEPGEIEVTLTVTDNDGQRDSVTKVFTVMDSQM